MVLNAVTSHVRKPIGRERVVAQILDRSHVCQRLTGIELCAPPQRRDGTTDAAATDVRAIRFGVS